MPAVTAAPKSGAPSPRTTAVTRAPVKAVPIRTAEAAKAAPRPAGIPAFVRSILPKVPGEHASSAPLHHPAAAGSHAATPKSPAPVKTAAPLAAAPVRDALKKMIAPPAAAKPKPAAPAPPGAAPAKPKLAPLAPPKTPASSGGQPLLPHVKEAIQNSLLVDLSSVRLHASTAAQRKTQSLAARAFTFGNDIFLGHGEHPTDLTLISHEAAHVIQQQRTAGVAQAWSSDRSDRYEREADQAAAAVVGGKTFAVRERVESPRVQRFGISDALDWIADKANIIPGFRMFTIVLGINPINMQHVERSAANVLRAVVEFIPGGGLITQALDKYGVFDKVGGWISDQIATLGMVGSSIEKALMDFLDSLSWTDVFHIGDVWDRAKRIFTDPIDKIINFAKGLIDGIWKFVREAILKPIAKLAESTAGWDLLCVVMGKNPITGEAVARTPEALIGGFMKLIHEEEIWENIKKANAIARAFAWFQSVLSGLLNFVSQIPELFVTALKSLSWTDIIDLPGGFMKVARVFGKFLGNFISWAGGKIWDLLQIIFEVVAPAVMPYLRKVGAAFKSILKHPLVFLRHLIDAGKLGLSNFMSKFGTHLKAALIDWLTGSLPGVYIPKAFSLPEFGLFALSVLGITWAQIRAKIVKALGPRGETIMKGLETTFDVVVALVRGGPAAAWELIKDKLSNLKDTIISGIVSFVTDTIIKKAIPKLISMFIPGAGFISAILSIYDTIMVFVQKISKIVQAVKAFVDSIVAIASGQIAGAAAKVESGFANMLSLAISFLAGFLGLGKISDKILAVIKKVQETVDKALEVGINWIVGKAKALFAKLFGGDKETDKGKNYEEAFAAVHAVVSKAEAEGKKPEEINAVLAPLRSQYPFKRLEVQQLEDEIDVVAEINPVEIVKLKGGKLKLIIIYNPKWALDEFRSKAQAIKAAVGKKAHTLQTLPIDKDTDKQMSTKKLRKGAQKDFRDAIADFIETTVAKKDQAKANSLLKKLQADHQQELQLHGQDDPKNLAMVEGEMNTQMGWREFRPALVKLKPGTIISAVEIDESAAQKGKHRMTGSARELMDLLLVYAKGEARIKQVRDWFKLMDDEDED